MHALRLFWAARNEEMWLRRQRRFRDRQMLESIEEMPELLFVQRFRLDKATFRWLCSELRSRNLLRGTAEIPLEVKVLCALSFLATGSDQRIVGLTQHLPQRTTSRCISELTEALNNDAVMRDWIVFPNSQQERAEIRQEFLRRFHLPGIIGLMDCTHVPIIRPACDEHLYFNRKGHHSLNIQMICDHNLRILNVNAKFGGAAHDSHIWSASRAESYMRQLHQNGEAVWLLGDSGYPLRPWLMTPILNAAPGSQEEMYTSRHVQARNGIERCFGVLKARWRCLNKERALHYEPQVARKIVLACCVLHNIALSARLPPPTDAPLAPVPTADRDENVSSPLDTNQSELIMGRAVRTALISRLSQR